MDFKQINIGHLIKQSVLENKIEISRICNFLKCTEEEIEIMYSQKSMDTDLLLKWSKLLEYDFFRLYTQHLILYAPPSKTHGERSSLPRFRKNVYTQGIITFILEQIETGEMTKQDVMKKYRIPKTTLYKWIDKYKNLK